MPTTTTKLAALALIACAAAASSASASYLTYTSSVVFSNPTPSSAGASVTNTGGNASFQTTDIGSDGFFNSITLTHKDSTAANNASGTGTNIGWGTPHVVGYEQATQNVGVDFAVTFNFNEYADALKTILTGTGTATVNGHIAGTLGEFGGTTSATYASPTVDFATATSTYRLSNFAFTGGDADNGGSTSAHLQAVPEPTSLAAIALAAAALIRRRRA